MVQKSRLIEKIAGLMEVGKLPLVADIRDESDENVRIVIEPKSRVLEPASVMAQLYSASDLMSKFSMNMNVLDADGVPRVMNLKEVLQAYIAHQTVVLTRRTSFRIGNIKRRLEVLGGLLIAYLNLDEVIAIIRENDEPKPILIERFGLTEVQAESILNMRLRNLRKLEEMQIKGEAAELEAELSGLENLMSSDAAKLKRIAADVKEMRGKFSKNTRLSEITADEIQVTHDASASIPSLPITVVISKMGFIRAMKGHAEIAAGFQFKPGDELAFAFHAMTNDKVVMAVFSGQFYTMDAAKIPTGRGFGDVIRLSLEIPPEAVILDAFAVRTEGRYLIVSRFGYGFAVEGSALVASTRYGKTVMSTSVGDELAAIIPIDSADDSVAIIGTNRKMLVFPLESVPVMTKGKGVILQKYKEGGAVLADVITFASSRGLGAKLRDVSMWEGKRADAGRMPPTGLKRFAK